MSQLREPAQPSPLDLGQLLRWVAALLSLGAAGIHFAVAPAHFEEYWLFGWFFLAAAWLQAIWAPVVVTVRRRWVLYAGLAGNLILVAIWLWTRVVSVPIGPESGETESVGLLDGTAVVFELNAVLAALLVWMAVGTRTVSARPSWRVAAAWLLLVSLLVISLSGLSLALEDENAHGGEAEPASHQNRDPHDVRP